MPKRNQDLNIIGFDAEIQHLSATNFDANISSEVTHICYIYHRSAPSLPALASIMLNCCATFSLDDVQPLSNSFFE